MLLYSIYYSNLSNYHLWFLHNYMNSKQKQLMCMQKPTAGYVTSGFTHVGYIFEKELFLKPYVKPL